tara:strand:- start:81 stop:281 length:201 start_codon:yes stop_codon:yes gene_type:complete
MKFYELRQQGTGGTHNTMGFFRKKKDAQEYSRLFNTKVVVAPLDIVEHEFINAKDFEDDLKELDES